MINILIGYDPRTAVAYSVLARSIEALIHHAAKARPVNKRGAQKQLPCRTT